MPTYPAYVQRLLFQARDEGQWYCGQADAAASCYEVLALFPGVSRSGSTIAAGLTRDVRRADAARFSFLMAVPVMLGAGGVALMDLAQLKDWTAHLGPLLVGFLSAGVVGYLSIRWLLGYLKQRSLKVFVAYCLVVGLVGLVMGIVYG